MSESWAVNDPAGLAERLAVDFRSDNEHWTAEHIALTEIPAPPYAEGPRGADFAARCEGVGLVDVGVDAVGNVYGRYPLGGPGPRLAVSAHLDTVFGPEVDCTVHRSGERLQGPGVCDDVAGLVMLLAVAKTFLRHRVRPAGELWLVATVGEESVGNLRGARKLAADGVAGRRLDGFITLDTATPGHIIRHGTHSANYDLTLRGPGGHAWGDFGVVNPTVTLARVVSRVSEYPFPLNPRTTFNCGLLHGGFAPNAIPQETRVHLNLRSESAEQLRRLVDYTATVIDEEVRAANAARRHGPELSVTRETNGRPGGETPVDSRLVRAAIAAAERLDQPVSHPYSSTDANAFMAAGIDAVCLYRGEGGGEHTEGEWYDAGTRPEALRQLAETVLRYFDGRG